VGKSVLIILLPVIIFGVLGFTHVNSKPGHNSDALRLMISPTPEILYSEESEPNQKNLPSTTVNPDPIVICHVNQNCGGGTKELRQSVCNRSTCCQIGNVWIFYEDKQKCFSDQKSQSATQIPTSIPSYHNDLINCYVSFPCTGYSYNYMGSQSDCDTTKQNAITSCNNGPEISVSIPTVVPTKDPEAIQACKDRANDTYLSQERNCRNISRGYGAESSTWYNNCALAALREKDSQTALCEH
jgi:hypothetical protein